jgi:hypothetical protein
MQSLKYLASFAAFALVLSTAAFAKDTNHGSFDLTQTARVGATELHPGHYKVQWNGPDSAVRISILQNGKTVATAQGQLKQLPEAFPYSSVVVRTLSNNTERIDEIDFGNHREALVLSGAQS